MNTKLYVGNLDWGTTSDQLKELFAKAGEVVDAVVIMDRQTGRSRGFGFVEFADEKSAEAVVKEFSGKEFNGRELVVNEARERAED